MDSYNIRMIASKRLNITVLVNYLNPITVILKKIGREKRIPKNLIDVKK